MTGVDISEEFLAAARGEDPEGKVNWVLADMRELSREGNFDGAYCFGNSFSYLDHTGNCDFLAALSESLRPGARFALDTGIAAESILPTLEPRIEMTLNDIEFSAENHYRAEASRLDTDYTFVRGGRTETRSGSHQVYTSAEIGRLLGEAGLAVREFYAGLEGEAYQAGCPRLLLIAEKVAP